jgi:hypothetical protein
MRSLQYQGRNDEEVLAVVADFEVEDASRLMRRNK